MSELLAWAIPTQLSARIEHTWITTYDSSATPLSDFAAVVAAGEDYWPCWGDFHPVGREIMKTPANVILARCYATSNDSWRNPATRGTITHYGMQGVCHQLSNQILAASSGPRVTVSGAKGYRASISVYGTYGLDKSGWLGRQRQCAGVPRPIARVGPSAGSTLGLQVMGTTELDEFDEFDGIAKHALAERPDLLDQLRLLRIEAQHAVIMLTIAKSPAESLNESNQRYFDAAADLLGAGYFEEIFGIPPGERIDLVDPRFHGE